MSLNANLVLYMPEYPPKSRDKSMTNNFYVLKDNISLLCRLRSTIITNLDTSHMRKVSNAIIAKRIINTLYKCKHSIVENIKLFCLVYLTGYVMTYALSYHVHCCIVCIVELSSDCEQ